MTAVWLVGGLLWAACVVATWLWARSAPTIVSMSHPAPTVNDEGEEGVAS